MPLTAALQMRSPKPILRSSLAGFSMVEIIAVMALFIILMALAVPSFTAITRSSALTSSTQIVTAQLSLARQSAITSSEPVEVRFYQYNGASPTAAGKSAYQALQSFRIRAAGEPLALGKVARLTGSTVLDGGPDLSSVLNQPLRPAVSGAVAVGERNLSCQIASFRFLPDGSTDLPKAGNLWFLTLHDLKDGDNLTSPPPNFATIQIDALNGHLREFRP